jgi:hypothetical protein
MDYVKFSCFKREQKTLDVLIEFEKALRKDGYMRDLMPRKDILKLVDRRTDMKLNDTLSDQPYTEKSFNK